MPVLYAGLTIQFVRTLHVKQLVYYLDYLSHSTHSFNVARYNLFRFNGYFPGEIKLCQSDSFTYYVVDNYCWSYGICISGSILVKIKMVKPFDRFYDFDKLFLFESLIFISFKLNLSIIISLKKGNLL